MMRHVHIAGRKACNRVIVTNAIKSIYAWLEYALLVLYI